MAYVVPVAAEIQRTNPSPVEASEILGRLVNTLERVLKVPPGGVFPVPLAVVGFSLGANLVLKLAAEAAQEPVAGLDCVLAANPPLDLAACCRQIQRPENRIYDRNFVRNLRREVDRLHAAFPELGTVDLSRAATILDFDELYTAPRNGFADALDYYRRASALPLVGRITAPTLILTARDDPFIAVEPFEELTPPAAGNRSGPGARRPPGLPRLGRVGGVPLGRAAPRRLGAARP